MPALLLLSLGWAIYLGRNEGDLFLHGRISIRCSDNLAADAGLIHRSIVDAGFLPVGRHPLLGKMVHFADGEGIALERIYRLGSHGFVYAGGHNDGVSVLTLLAKKGEPSRLAAQTGLETLERSLIAALGKSQVDTSRIFDAVIAT